MKECFYCFYSECYGSGHDWQYDTVPAARIDIESKKNKNICLYNDEKLPGEYEISCILSMLQTMDYVFCKYGVMNKSLSLKLTKHD